MKNTLIVVVLAVFVGLLVFRSEPDGPAAPDSPTARPGPWFEVQVVKPRSARPFAGLLPEGAFGLPPSVLRFDDTSPGAEVVRVGRHQLELRAEGWDLVIETDGDGQGTLGVRVVFPVELANRLRTLRCRPEGLLSGYYRTTSTDGADVLDGEFSFELPTCEDAGTGKVVAWPATALTVRGSFKGL